MHGETCESIVAASFLENVIGPLNYSIIIIAIFYLLCFIDPDVRLNFCRLHMQIEINNMLSLAYDYRSSITIILFQFYPLFYLQKYSNEVCDFGSYIRKEIVIIVL